MSNVWRRSSHSNSTGRSVEVATIARKRGPGEALPTGRLVAARDSQNPQRPALCLTPASWLSLVEDIKFGALD
jgi:hypothetical protein